MKITQIAATQIRLFETKLRTCYNLAMQGSIVGREKIADGVVHDVPMDLKRALASSATARATWEDITPLARNEWICWVTSAKKAETRLRRIEWACTSLTD